MEHKYEGEKIILSGCLVINDNNKILLLYRKDHKHYETPGGKARVDDCANENKCTIEDLKTVAKRELYEELGKDIKVKELEYFGKIEFMTPSKKLAIANKFITKIIAGKPKINEPELFSKMDYLPIEKLEKYPISPDLKLLLPKLKKKKLKSF